jgi:peptidoglycan/xylan/chitin deacetylase (PgdA/CDA1 family)
MMMSLSGLPILTYHSFDDSGSVISTSPATFEMQMKYLAQSGYQSLSLSEATVYIREKKPIPEKAFVMTFDDGYQNNYTQAFPIMQEVGFKGTIFLISAYCEKSWSGDESSLEARPMLSWSEVKEVHRYGIEFGAHTSTHPDLTRIPIEQAEGEIRESRMEIQDRLGADGETFAYTYGSFNANVKELVKREFHAACSTRLGRNEPGDDPYSLKRIDMFYLSNFALFTKLATRKLAWYLRLRQVPRDLKLIMK